MAKDKEYSTPVRDTDKSLMDTLAEIGTAVMEGFRGSQRASQNPASEGSRARNRTEQRMRETDTGGRLSDRDVETMRKAVGKAYGGKAKKKMMCGGKAKK